MRFKISKKTAALTAAVMMIQISAASVLPVYGAEPGLAGQTAAQAAGYDEATWAKLTDQTMEYDELGDLVKNFNPDISEAWSSYNDSQKSMQNMIDELARYRDNMKDLQKDAKKDGQYDDYAQYYVQVATLNAYTEVYRNAIKTFDKMKTKRQLVQAEAQVTNGVQQLMIGYQSIEAQKQNLTELKSMYDAMYKLTTQQQALGMATAADVLTAQKNQLSAQSSLQSLQSTEDGLKRSLLLMTGWNVTDQPVIEAIPHADQNRIASMNPDNDLAKAIGNNYTLIAARHAKAKGTKNTDMKARTAEEQEQQLAIVLKNLYQDVLAKQTAYETAKTGYESGLLSKQAADTQYQLGMLNEAQYIGSNMTYIQKKAAYEAADITLFQAMETYDWAVAGNVAIE